MGTRGEHNSGGRQSNLQPLIAVLVTIYLVFAVALAHTAYVAIQGRSTAAAGLEASHDSLTAFKELKDQISDLKKQLSEAQAGMAAQSSNSSVQLAANLQQLKKELAESLSTPLQHTTKAAEEMLTHTTKMDSRFADLQAHVSKINDKIAAPPVGAHVEDKELHHIVTATSVCDKRGASGLSLNVTSELVAPLVIVGHNRPGYLAKTMMVLMKYWTQDPSHARKFPLFISIDGDDQRTLLLATAMHQAAGVQIITRRRDDGPKCGAPDCHISQHYKLLLKLFLDCFKAPGLLFLEEDLEIAPDFFNYFEAVTPLMNRDPSIYCVSAWNDHGQRGRVKDNRALYRTDVMPGLGWYLNSRIGLELAPKWPMTNWDDWMRLPGIKNGRSCIYPEVSRTYTFGRVGTHMGEGFDHHLGVMKLNDEPVDWKSMDLDFLLQSNYTDLFIHWMDKGEVWEGSLEQLQAYCAINQPDDTERPWDLVYRYPGTKQGFESTAKHLKPMMGDVREGTPRGSYFRHLVVRCRGRRLFLRAV